MHKQFLLCNQISALVTSLVKNITDPKQDIRLHRMDFKGGYSARSLDFVLVKHQPISSKVDDFCIVEFQSDSTTGTGELVQALKDFMKEKDVLQNKYRFGMNT